MAVTQNTYTGNGSTVLYSFSFPYIETTDIKVSLDGVVTTAYTLANATTVQFNTAPANDVAIRIYRDTDDENAKATFVPGAAIRAQDLNDNFDQILFVSQESSNDASSAVTTANTALTNSSTALTNSTTAVSTANTALSTANTASTNASAAVTTANTASTNASTALSTANTAIANSATAVSTANAASTTANTASTNASNAVTTANTASTNASAAVTTANTAASDASTALSTANTALSTANNAQTVANTADANASAALTAVAGTLQYVLVANVASIPGSPSNGDAIEIADSTGLESFTPLTNIPAGFVGDSGLSARIQYLSAGSTWNWLNYYPNNAETRYLKLSGGTLTGQLKADDSTSVTSPVYAFDGDTNTGIARTGADELALVTGGTARVTVDPAGAVAITNSLTVGGETAVVDNDARLTDTRTPTDSSVTDAKVSATAAIAGTKISPDFGSQNILTTGTATAASLIPSGSSVPTNGVYLPSANNVAISTNGTGRISINADGDVDIDSGGVFYDATNNRLGIGTSSPGANLDIAGSIPVFRLTDTDAANTFSTIEGNNGALLYQSDKGNAQPNSGHFFYVDTVERLRIDSSGRVGIGTTSPSGELHIAGSDANTDIFVTEGSTNTDARIRNSNGVLLLDADVNNENGGSAIVLGVDGTERLRITSAGLVGIGTSAPSTALDVNGTINVRTNGFEFGRITTNNVSGIDGGLSFQTILNGTFSTKMVLDAAGRLGIGTTSPSDALHVLSSGGNARIDTSTNAGTASLLFDVPASNGLRASGHRARISCQHEGAGWDSSLVFYAGNTSTSPSEAMRIDASRRLLVGTSSAQGNATLQIQGDAASSTNWGQFFLRRGQSITTIGANVGSRLGQINFGNQDGAVGATIQADTDATWSTAGSGDYPTALVFSTTSDQASSPTEKLRIDNAGTIQADGRNGTSAQIYYSILPSPGTSRNHFLANTVGVGTWALQGNGTSTFTSDERRKKNIETTRDGYLNDINRLRVVKYNWKALGDDSPKELGLIAQEVEQVFPGLISEYTDPDEDVAYKALKHSVLPFILLKALQEASSKIEALEANNADLLARVTALESA